MTTLCTYCGFNWAQLKSIEADGEETIEVCPECGSDSFLIPGTGEQFIKSEFTGEITNLSTGRYYESPMQPVAVTPYNQPWEENYKAKEQKEDAAINAYLLNGKSEQAYINAFNKRK